MKLRFEYPAPVIVKLKYRKRGAVTDWYASHHDKRKRASFGLSFPSAPRLPKREPMEAGDFGSIVTEKAGTATDLLDMIATSLPLSLSFSGSCMMKNGCGTVDEKNSDATST